MKNGMKLVVGSVVAMVVVVFGAWCFSGEGYQIKAEAEKVGPEYSTAMPCENTESPLYSVNGCTLDPGYQVYIYRIMVEHGCGAYFRYWLAEIYQESGYHADATDGESYGLCQLNGRYHSELIREYGLAEGTDLVGDVFANLYVGTRLFCDRLYQNDLNLEGAIMDYFNSGDTVTEHEYLQQVSQWFGTITKIN